MIGPFPVAAVVERLTTSPSPLKLLGGCADLKTALRQKPAATPACFVVIEEHAEPADRGSATGVLKQRCHVAVQLVLFVRNAAGPSGAKAAEEMDAVLGWTRQRLLNWTPDPAAFPLAFQAKRDEGYEGADLCAQQVFRSTYRIEVRT